MKILLPNMDNYGKESITKRICPVCSNGIPESTGECTYCEEGGEK